MNAEVEIKQNNATAINDEAIVSHEERILFFISKINFNSISRNKKGGSENGFTEVISLDGKDFSPNFNIVNKRSIFVINAIKK